MSAAAACSPALRVEGAKLGMDDDANRSFYSPGGEAQPLTVTTVRDPCERSAIVDYARWRWDLFGRLPRTSLWKTTPPKKPPSILSVATPTDR